MAGRNDPRFGDFRLDLGKETLWRGWSEVRLTPRAFVLLRHLVEHADRLVTKEELLDAVWGGLHVGDSVVKVRIAELRQALSDSAEEPRYIATIHRRGYRFVAAVSGDAVPAASATRPSAVQAFARGLPGPGGGVGLAHAPPAPFVGRGPVLARLEARLGMALAGERQVVFVAGDAGIGKTALVGELLRHASRMSESRIAIGRCADHYGTGEPYLPWLEALGRLCKDDRGRLLTDVLRRHAPMWLLQLPWLVEPHDRAALQREVLGGSRERMQRELDSALEAFTAEHPLVLVLEDLHWSDASTLDLVRSLAQSRTQARLLLLVSYRASDAIARGHPVRALRNELHLHDECHEEILDLLTRADVADYIAARLPAAEPSAPELAAIVHRRTDGHPLFMVSLVDDAIRSGILEIREGALRLRGEPTQLESGIPTSVREMVERDYERLDPRDRELLAAASVAGVEFSARVVAAAIESDAVEVERRCDDLVRSGRFLEAREASRWADGVVDASYAFRHALYQAVLYEEVPRAHRMRLHRSLGVCLEEKLADRVVERAAQLVLHFERGGDPLRAIAHLRRVADNAVRRCANREGIEALTRASDLLAEVPAESRGSLELDVREQLGLVRRSMGDMRGAAADFDAVVALARRAGSVDREAKALLYLCSALTWIDRERRSATLAEAIRVAERVEDELLRAHALGYAAYWNLSLRGWSAEQERACAAAVEAARRAGDRELQALHVGRSAYFHCMHADYDLACRTAEEGLEHAFAVGNAFEAMACQHYRSSALLESGRWGEMLDTLQEAIAVAERNGHRLWASFFHLQIALLCLQTGAFERAKAIAERGLEESRTAGHVDGEVFALTVLAQSLLGLGDHEAGMSTLAHMEERAGPDGALGGWISHMSFRQAIADHWLGRGDVERARVEAERILRLARPPGQKTYVALARVTLAAVAAELGERRKAEDELRGALEIVERANVPLAAWRVHALAARWAKLREDHARAVDHRRRSAAVAGALTASLGDRDPELRAAFLGRMRGRASAGRRGLAVFRAAVATP